MVQMQKKFGDVVAYIDGGSRLNATVMQSSIQKINSDPEVLEEQLILKVPDPSQAANSMTSTQLEQSMRTLHGVRPIAATKPADGSNGTGWANVSDPESRLQADDSAAKLKNLVVEINAGHPVDAYGHDVKDSTAFIDAAKQAGVQVIVYDKDSVHSQIMREFHYQGSHRGFAGQKPITPAVPIAQATLEGEGETYLDHKEDGFAGDGNPYGMEAMTNQGFHESATAFRQPDGGAFFQGTGPGDGVPRDSGKSQEQVSIENTAQYDQTKHAQLAEKAIADGQLDAAALNEKPETHPEFGEKKTEGDTVTAEPVHVEAELPFTIRDEENGKFSIVDANGLVLTDPATGVDEQYDSREQAEEELKKYQKD